MQNRRGPETGPHTCARSVVFVHRDDGVIYGGKEYVDTDLQPPHCSPRFPLRRSLDLVWASAPAHRGLAVPMGPRPRPSLSVSLLEGRLGRCLHPRLSRHLTLSFNRSKPAQAVVLVPFLTPCTHPPPCPSAKSVMAQPRSQMPTNP